MLRRRMWIFPITLTLVFRKYKEINIKIFWKLDIYLEDLSTSFNITTADKPEHCGNFHPPFPPTPRNSLWQNPPKNKLLVSRMWKWQYNIAGFDPSVSSESCLLLLGLYHTAPTTPSACAQSQKHLYAFTKTHFLLLSQAQEAILLHSSEITRKIIII